VSTKFEKLKSLLRELFQLDQPDLDFGLYRIMHAKAAEVTAFLERDLLPQVKAEFGQYKTADKAELQKELEKAIEQAQSLGADPESLPKVKDLRAKLKNDAVDIAGLENDVYDHLLNFFSRYYCDGDFVSKRKYSKDGKYAIPYDGEEVKLYWANHDQYYIKTSEYLRDYTFRLKPDDDEKPMRVHFRLVDVAEGEHGNVKPANGKDRVFILAGTDPVFLEANELICRFEYRPATLTDWPDDVRSGKTKPPAQKDLTAIAEARILATDGRDFAPWVAELAKPHVKADGEKAEYNRLRAHLNRYVGRNTFDYFIHKDLGGFLKRELDFFIKNEVMMLDDIENETAPRVEQYLSKIKVIRRIAGKIIAFLAQLEDFQKALWLKKKFVVETQYCVAIKEIPEEFLPKIVANAAQWAEWESLHHLSELKKDDDGLFAKKMKLKSPEFLKANPSLMIDTRHFDAEFTARLLDALGELDAKTDGVLFHSENFQALNLMQARYRERVKCVYIDPPYNTGGDGFAYKDSYRHSSWASMLQDRVAACLGFIVQDGALFASIDEVEQPVMRQIFNSLIGSANFVSDLVWAAGRKNDSRLVSVSHEYIVAYARNREQLTAKNIEWRQRKKGLDDIYGQYERLKRQHKTDYKAITEGLKAWFVELADSHPSKAHRHYNQADSKGVYFAADISWPGGGGPKYEVLHPKTKKPVKVPSRGWMTSDPEKMKQWIADDRVHFGDDETAVPCIKSYLKDREHQAPYSVFYQDGRAATKRLRDVLGTDDFGYPKDETVISELVEMLASGNESILDFFAGSGTTGHAVINLNREDGGRRKVILVEMADYFDTVLLPRLKKVAFTPEWKDGQPKRLPTAEEAERGPRVFKIVRLESYEDTLNNLELKRSPGQQSLLDSSEAQGADKLREQYLLQYLLKVESRESSSLLNVAAFTDPTAYKLVVKRPGSDESREVNVDLIETFNWLLGLTVEHIAAPLAFTAEFERDAEKRLRLKGRLKPDAAGPHWFRTVTGTTPDGRKVLVIWRKLTGTPEEDNLVLDEWFTKQGYSSKDSEFGLIYVNGGNNLENLKTPDDTWKVRLIEDDFHRLMFAAEGV
jgi:adenine-specific DNA-methyltransferase